MKEYREIPHEEMWTRPNLFRRIGKGIRECDPTKKEGREGKLIRGFVGIILEIVF